MSDELLRAAEQRWTATGALEDEAEVLRLRVRAGDLAKERLELAARCGHEGALAASGGGDASRDFAGLFEALLALGQLGSRAACVAALAARRDLGPVPTAAGARAHSVASAWISCPSVEHVREVMRVRDEALTNPRWFDSPEARSFDLPCLNVVIKATLNEHQACVELAQLLVELSSLLWGQEVQKADFERSVLRSIQAWALRSELPSLPAGDPAEDDPSPQRG